MVVTGENIREIHKYIYRNTIKMPKMTLMLVKISNKAKKSIDRRKTQEENAIILGLLYKKQDYNGKIKSVINHELMEEAEKEKDSVVKSYIKQARTDEKWIYIASSHNDCAEDHKPWQGRLYYDNKAPQEIAEWCQSRNMHTLQWVIDAPAWFITRPNCRHFVKALSWDTVKKYSRKEITRRYKMHRSEGDKRLSTPKRVVIEEYEDRLNLLEAMYRKYPVEQLRRDIQKTKILLKKWKNLL